jgi:flavin reductase (DIM6/NTAB) family NADH-FMN oxidoreductase RutF
MSASGIHNLAPYSQFQNLTFDPPYVMFAANQNTNGQRKDSVVNIEETGEFVHNMATYDLREAVNKSAEGVPPEVDEFEIAGVTKVPSRFVKPARVAESPIHFECHYYQTLRLPVHGLRGTVDIIIGRVIGIHIKDEFIAANGKLDILKLRPIARMGYFDYTRIDSIFEMVIPGTNPDLHSGMEGMTSKRGEE